MDNFNETSYTRAVLLASTAFTFLNFGLPIHADNLGISAVAIGGMYTVFMGTMLIVRPVVGWCLDRFGRRWFFTGAFVFYVVAMAAFSVSESVAGFYLARFLQGIGASLMWVSARTIIADVQAEQSRGEAMGRLTVSSVRGSMLGAFYGFGLIGFLPMAYAWRYAFIGYAAAALFGLFWALLRMQETRLPVHKETEAVPGSILTQPLRRIFVVVFLSAFATALIEPIYLLYLKNKFDVNVLVLAWVFFPAGIVYAILPQYSGKWSDRWGRGPVIALGILLAGLVALALPFWPSLWMIAVSYLLFAVGWAIASPAEEALVVDHAPESHRGRVIGSKEAAAGAGAALGPLLGGYLYENVADWSAFVVNASVLFVTAGLAWWWFVLKLKPAPEKTGAGSASSASS